VERPPPSVLTLHLAKYLQRVLSLGCFRWQNTEREWVRIRGLRIERSEALFDRQQFAEAKIEKSAHAVQTRQLVFPTGRCDEGWGEGEGRLVDEQE
jgi:hypothetical protein